MSDVLRAFAASKKEVADIRYVLPGSGQEIFMHPFTTSEQKAMMKAYESEDQVLIQEALDTILKNCVVKPENFNPSNLFSPDRECLLIELSKKTVKDDISHQWACAKCKGINTTSVSLNDLDYSAPVEDSIKQEEIEFEGFDFTVRVTNLTRHDEKKIFALAKRESNEEGGVSEAELVNATYAAVMKEYKKVTKQKIRGEGDNVEEIDQVVYEKIKFEDRLEIFAELSLEDKKKIQDFISSVKPYGYDVDLGFHECKRCQAENSVKMDWSDFFIQ